MTNRVLYVVIDRHSGIRGYPYRERLAYPEASEAEAVAALVNGDGESADDPYWRVVPYSSRADVIDEAVGRLREMRDKAIAEADDDHRRCLYDAEARERTKASTLSAAIIELEALGKVP
ncbi:MAG: hypothetical protein EHM84_00855 [Lysobacterales bacterium]|nr:MAG: hypothetical protein EHM84_00855 [Xanthomonadales bacterium]